MDGVLVNSEHPWLAPEKRILDKFVPADVRTKMGSLIGLGVQSIHDKALAAGHSIEIEKMRAAYLAASPQVYRDAAITSGVGELIEKLSAWGYKLGMVTASPQQDIEIVLSRIPETKKFEVVISLGDQRDFQHKPAPDGYLEAFRRLDADAGRSFVLEDSNPGIAAGKAAGAYVIGFRANLIENYEQYGADKYADTMEEVAEIVDSLDRD